jgi:hypothetical protein
MSERLAMRLAAALLLPVMAMLCCAGFAHANDSVRYLAFQIFTPAPDSDAMRQNLPPQPRDLRQTVSDLKRRIGVEGSEGRRLGFVLGLIAFDHTDHEAADLIREGFDIAMETNVAVGFHLDESTFWGRLYDLDNPSNIEWLDWQGTPNTGRRLDWSTKPTKIMPQLCINSAAVRAAVSKRAAFLGREIAGGVERLRAAHREELYLGVIAGSETQIGRDFDTGKSLGYCALTNAGFSAGNPPADPDVERARITTDFIGFWVRSLIGAGVPADKVYSHIAFMSSTMYRIIQQVKPDAITSPYLQFINFTPPATAFCEGCIPGLSTYPQPGHLEQWREELSKHGNPPWASSEGTAADPFEAERGGKAMSMEGYLGNLFNHGAVLVNVFGWGIGDSDNPFRKIAESPSALAAYGKFLRAEDLQDAPIPIPEIPPDGLIDKIHKVQADLPGWVQKNGPSLIADNLHQLDQAMKDKHFDAAAKAAEAILKAIGD